MFLRKNNNPKQKFMFITEDNKQNIIYLHHTRTKPITNLHTMKNHQLLPLYLGLHSSSLNPSFKITKIPLSNLKAINQSIMCPPFKKQIIFRTNAINTLHLNPHVWPRGIIDNWHRKKRYKTFQNKISFPIHTQFCKKHGALFSISCSLYLYYKLEFPNPKLYHPITFETHSISKLTRIKKHEFNNQSMGGGRNSWIGGGDKRSRLFTVELHHQNHPPPEQTQPPIIFSAQEQEIIW